MITHYIITRHTHTHVDKRETQERWRKEKIKRIKRARARTLSLAHARSHARIYEMKKKKHRRWLDREEHRVKGEKEENKITRRCVRLSVWLSGCCLSVWLTVWLSSCLRLPFLSFVSLRSLLPTVILGKFSVLVTRPNCSCFLSKRTIA